MLNKLRFVGSSSHYDAAEKDISVDSEGDEMISHSY